MNPSQQTFIIVLHLGGRPQSNSSRPQHPQLRSASPRQRCRGANLDDELLLLPDAAASSTTKGTTSRRLQQHFSTSSRHHESPQPSRQRQRPRRAVAAIRQCSRIPQPNGRQQNIEIRRVSSTFIILLNVMHFKRLLFAMVTKCSFTSTFKASM